MEKTIYFDMDGTLAVWKPVELTLESEEEAHNVQEKVYEILKQDGYFHNLATHPHMIEAVKQLMNTDGVKVKILSCYISNCSAKEDKRAWLKEHLPGLMEENIELLPDGMNKSLWINPSENDLLVDDYSKNLKQWNGIGMKAMNGINGTKGTWKGNMVSVDADADEIVRAILNALE